MTRIKQSEAQELRITGVRILEELEAIAFADIGDYYVNSADEGGNPVRRVKPSADLTRAQTAAIKAVRSTSKGLEIRLHNRTAALKLLGDFLGIQAPFNLSAITPELVSVVINAEKEKCYVA